MTHLAGLMDMGTLDAQRNEIAMNNQPLEIKVAIQIQKPVNLVFEVIVDPSMMDKYFISKSNGRMEEGKTLVWQFPEFDMDVPIQVGKIVRDQLISYSWSTEGNKHLTEMTLKAAKNDSTIVTITEKSIDNIRIDKLNGTINWLKGNTEGWANFLACLKAYLEYGINLRKGAFDFLSSTDSA